MVMSLKRIHKYQSGGQFSDIQYTPINIETSLQEETPTGDSLYVDNNYVQLETSGNPTFYQPKYDLSGGTKTPNQTPIQNTEGTDPTPETSTDPMEGVDTKKEEKKEVEWKQPETKTTQTNTTLGTISFKGKIDVGNMQPVLDKFAEAGISVRVTSGVRKGARTKSGNASWHASGNAIDITPVAGETMDQLINKIKNSPELVNWLNQNGYGILRETTDKALGKTGGTGYHLHIGKDTNAKKDLAALVANKPPILAQLGTKFDKIKYSVLNPQESYLEHKANLQQQVEKAAEKTESKKETKEETPKTEIQTYQVQFAPLFTQPEIQKETNVREVIENPDGSKIVYPNNYVETPIVIPARTSTNFADKTYSSNKELAADFIDRYYNILSSKNIKDAKQKAIILAAQDMLESGWGKSGLSKYNNFGGVKAGDGSDYIELSTTEYKHNKPHTVKQKFRKFKDIEEFIENKYNLYNTEKYANALNGDYKSFINNVAKIYATDPNYAKRWNSVVKYLNKLNSEWVV